MKISSSTIAYGSSHFLETQENYSLFRQNGTSVSIGRLQRFGGEISSSYQVQLAGKSEGIKGLYQPTHMPPMDWEAVNRAEMAKLSTEDRQRVDAIQTHIQNTTEGHVKVVVFPKSVDSILNVENPTLPPPGSLERPVQTICSSDLFADALLEASEKSSQTVVKNGSVDLPATTPGSSGVPDLASQYEELGGAIQAQIGNIKVDTFARVPGYSLAKISDDSGSFVMDTHFEVTQQKKTTTEKEYTAWSTTGQVQMEDGRSIAVEMSSLMLRSAQTDQVQTTLKHGFLDPLTINFGTKTAQLSDAKYEFDLDADGKKDSISFVGPGSGFLTLDKNGDGIVNDGNELFGTKSGNGFNDLAAHDGNGNGWIDENDEIYGKLRLWTKNEQGLDQLLTLKEAGVGAIYLGSADTPFMLKGSDNQTLGRVTQSGFFLREDGTSGTVQDIDLAVKREATAAEELISSETASQMTYSESGISSGLTAPPLHIPINNEATPPASQSADIAAPSISVTAGGAAEKPLTVTSSAQKISETVPSGEKNSAVKPSEQKISEVKPSEQKISEAMPAEQKTVEKAPAPVINDSSGSVPHGVTTGADSSAEAVESVAAPNADHPKASAETSTRPNIKTIKSINMSAFFAYQSAKWHTECNNMNGIWQLLWQKQPNREPITWISSDWQNVISIYGKQNSSTTDLSENKKGWQTLA